ncbi:nonribosomal peptide synthetase ecdA [Physcia stellaris]|nr:nonribosomal peptide synthetase ecdA [Physcia stellaris]
MGEILLLCAVVRPELSSYTTIRYSLLWGLTLGAVYPYILDFALTTSRLYPRGWSDVPPYENRDAHSNQVVGAGAVGLAIARKLAARDGTSTLLIEKHGAAGTETSSRNSEVIHAGIYYGPDSLKTALCLKGKQMMYDLCEKQDIPYRNTKKWILAQDQQQHEELMKTHEFTKTIGVPTHFISLSEARAREPDVLIKEACLESPTTGIIDSHAYMTYLESDFQSLGGDVAYHTTVQSIEPVDSGAGGYKIHTKSPSSGEVHTVTAETLINSAGLAAVPLSNSILPESRHVKPYYAKGSYYGYPSSHPRPKTLIYPAPTTGLLVWARTSQWT